MRTVDMIKVGFVMNVVCLTVTLAATYSYGVLLFDLKQFPGWAENSPNGTQVNVTQHAQCK